VGARFASGAASRGEVAQASQQPVHQDARGRVCVEGRGESAPRGGLVEVGGEHLGERGERLRIQVHVEAESLDPTLGQIPLQLGEPGVREHAASAFLAESLRQKLHLEWAAALEIGPPRTQAALEHRDQPWISGSVEAAGSDHAAQLEQQRRELRRGAQAQAGCGHRSPFRGGISRSRSAG
jgi:hypothetical protein